MEKKISAINISADKSTLDKLHSIYVNFKTDREQEMLAKIRMYGYEYTIPDVDVVDHSSVSVIYDFYFNSEDHTITDDMIGSSNPIELLYYGLYHGIHRTRFPATYNGTVSSWNQYCIDNEMKCYGTLLTQYLEQNVKSNVHYHGILELGNTYGYMADMDAPNDYNGTDWKVYCKEKMFEMYNMTLNYSYSHVYLGNYYGDIDDVKSMLNSYSKAVSMGNTSAMCELGDYYYTSNNAMTVKYYKMAVDNGSDTTGLADFYNGEEDVDNMMHYNMIAYERGNPQAMCNLGEYYKKIGYTNMMFKFFNMADKLGYTPVYALIATYYKEENDNNNMLKYNKLAVDSGNIDAIYEMATYYKDARESGNMCTYLLFGAQNDNVDCINEINNQLQNNPNTMRLLEFRDYLSPINKKILIKKILEQFAIIDYLKSDGITLDNVLEGLYANVGKIDPVPALVPVPVAIPIPAPGVPVAPGVPLNDDSDDNLDFSDDLSDSDSEDDLAALIGKYKPKKKMPFKRRVMVKRKPARKVMRKKKSIRKAMPKKILRKRDAKTGRYVW